MTEVSSWLDYGILGVILLSGLISLIRGFVREAFSLASWVAAFWIAITFNEDLAEHLKIHIVQPELRLAVSFGILFVGTLIVGGIINFILGSLMQRAGLSGTDRMLGVLFGVGRGILLVALLLVLATLTPIPQQPWWKQSQLIPYFKPLQDWMIQFIPHVDTEKSNELAIPTKSVEVLAEPQ